MDPYYQQYNWNGSAYQYSAEAPAYSTYNQGVVASTEYYDPSQMQAYYGATHYQVNADAASGQDSTVTPSAAGQQVDYSKAWDEYYDSYYGGNSSQYQSAEVASNVAASLITANAVYDNSTGYYSATMATPNNFALSSVTGGDIVNYSGHVASYTTAGIFSSTMPTTAFSAYTMTAAYNNSSTISYYTCPPPFPSAQQPYIQSFNESTPSVTASYARPRIQAPCSYVENNISYATNFVPPTTAYTNYMHAPNSYDSVPRPSGRFSVQSYNEKSYAENMPYSQPVSLTQNPPTVKPALDTARFVTYDLKQQMLNPRGMVPGSAWRAPNGKWATSLSNSETKSSTIATPVQTINAIGAPRLPTNRAAFLPNRQGSTEGSLQRSTLHPTAPRNVQNQPRLPRFNQTSATLAEAPKKFFALSDEKACKNVYLRPQRPSIVDTSMQNNPASFGRRVSLGDVGTPSKKARCDSISLSSFKEKEIVKKQHEVYAWQKAIKDCLSASEQIILSESEEYWKFLTSNLLSLAGTRIKYKTGAAREEERSFCAVRSALGGKILLDLYINDVFVGQGCGESVSTSLNDAASKALKLLQGKVFVHLVTRTYKNVSRLDEFMASRSVEIPDYVPELCCDASKPFSDVQRKDVQVKEDESCLSREQKSTFNAMAVHCDKTDQLKRVDVDIENVEALKDFFLVINHDNSKDKYADIMILNTSANFNGTKIEYKQEAVQPPSSSGSVRCVIYLKGCIIAKAEAFNYSEARRLACTQIVGKLRNRQPIVKMRLEKTRAVAFNEVYAPSTSTDAGKGESADKKAVGEEEKYFAEYIEKDEDVSLKFATGFTMEQLKSLQKVTAKFNVSAKLCASGARPFLLVTREYTESELKEKLLKNESCGQYQLVFRGSKHDLSFETTNEH